MQERIKQELPPNHETYKRPKQAVSTIQKSSKLRLRLWSNFQDLVKPTDQHVWETVAGQLVCSIQLPNHVLAMNYLGIHFRTSAVNREARFTYEIKPRP